MKYLPLLALLCHFTISLGNPLPEADAEAEADADAQNTPNNYNYPYSNYGQYGGGGQMGGPGYGGMPSMDMNNPPDMTGYGTLQMPEGGNVEPEPYEQYPGMMEYDNGPQQVPEAFGQYQNYPFDNQMNPPISGMPSGMSPPISGMPSGMSPPISGMPSDMSAPVSSMESGISGYPTYQPYPAQSRPEMFSKSYTPLYPGSNCMNVCRYSPVRRPRCNTACNVRPSCAMRKPQVQQGPTTFCNPRPRPGRCPTNQCPIAPPRPMPMPRPSPCSYRNPSPCAYQRQAYQRTYSGGYNPGQDQQYYTGSGFNPGFIVNGNQGNQGGYEGGYNQGGFQPIQQGSGCATGTCGGGAGPAPMAPMSTMPTSDGMVSDDPDSSN